MFKRRILISAMILLVMICSLSHAKEPPTSIAQLNSPEYVIGSDSGGPGYDAAIQTFTRAKHLHFNDAYSGIESLKLGKIDALACNEMEIKAALRDSLKGLKLLPGTIGEPAKIGAGIYKHSKIPNLKEKFDSFIQDIKNDGTFSAMFKRWVEDGNYEMPAIDVPAKSDLTLRVTTTGNVMPFSFYIGNTLTGFDIELARRFAAYLGAELEFTVNDFGGALSALAAGKADCMLSNLYITPERTEAITFSNVMYTVNMVVLVRDEGDQANDNGLQAFRGKRIGVPVGSSQSEIVREALPDSEMLYFEASANMIQALKSGKIDALVFDEPTAIEFERGNKELTRAKATLKPLEAGFIFPKKSGNEKLYSEIDNYIRRIKSDGTFDQLRELWFGDDESKKIIPDYTNFPDTNGVIRFAVNDETPPFNYIKDGRLTGFDIDVIARFCKEKGYRPNFSEMNFTAILPAVMSGKCDMSGITVSITPERSESVRFSEPLHTLPTVLLVVKPRDIPATTPAKTSGNERTPKYSTLSELDGKPIGVQTGVPSWEAIARKILPHSKIAFYNTFADLDAALKTHKIEGFFVDEPVYNLMAAEDKNLAKVDEKIDDYYTIAFGFAKTERGKKLCDEMSAYIRKIKANGELDAIIAKWESADDSAKTLPDYKRFPAPKGVLHVATEGEYPPFNYYRGNEIAGLEIDIAARFCEANGYGIEFTSMAWEAVIPAVVSGKYDFAAASLALDDEHSGEIYFSDPHAQSRSVMACLKADDSTSSKFAALDGKPIGMQPGIIDWEEWVAENLPHSKVQYYNTYTDLVAALKTHKIAGFLVDSPVLELMAAEDNTLTAIDEPIGKPFSYSFFYAKTKEGKKLCDEMSEYIRKIKASGELDAILSKWQGEDESAKIPPDFESLPAKNGTITYAAEGSYPPFSYYKGTQLAGIDIDLAVGFCREYGYGLNIQTMLFDATMAAINSGKVDFAGDFTPSEEHEEAVYFSEPYCAAHSVMACLKTENFTAPETVNPSHTAANFESLAGKKIGVQIGTTCAELVPERIPTAEISYYDSLTDQLTALKAGKVAAICCSLPAAIFAENEDSRLKRINPPLRETYLYPIFARTEQSRKLCDEYSAFLKTLWDDGTIDSLKAKWLGADEVAKTVDDYTNLPAMNGKIKMAVDASMIPFVYVRDNRIVGYDIDLAVRFCKAKGYALEVENMTFTGVIASVKSGKCDFTQSMNKTPERSENTLFTTTPTIKSGNVLLTMESHTAPYIVNIPLSEFSGKKVGLLIGSDSAKAIEDKIPGVKLRYFDSPSYILPALRSGRIDGFYCAVPTAVNIIQNHDDFAYIPEYVSTTKHTTMFPKTAKGRKLCAEYADFLKTLSADGELNTLSEKWITGTDESKQITEDYSNLPAHNGTLTLSVTEGMMPFVFVKDNRIQGYDIDLAVMFCKSKGCGLKIEVTNHNGVLSSLETGKCDFSYSVQWTKERDQTVLFSPIPNAITGSILVIRKREQMPIAEYTDISQLAGKNFGLTHSNTIIASVNEKIPDAEIVYFESYADLPIALITGKIDAFACSFSTVLSMIREKLNVTYLPQHLCSNYFSAAFAKTDKGRKLCDEYSEFLKMLSDDGTISRLKDKWIYSENDGKLENDYSDLPATNGTISMAVDPGTVPFAYVKDGKITGYDVELAAMFCKAKGYGLKFLVMNLGGILGAVQTGKCDFTCGMIYTEERAQSVLFSSVPNMEIMNVVVVRKMNPDSTHSAMNANLSDFAGKVIGVSVGTNHDSLVLKQIPSATIKYFSDPTDMTAALKSGKIDAFANTLPTAEYMLHEDKDLAYLPEHLNDTDYFTCFTDSEEGRKLCAEYSEFVQSLWGKGVIAQLVNKWIKSDNDSLRTTEDYSKLPAANGTLKMAADSGFVPFSYVKDNRIVGYDIDIAVMFCKEKGYGLEVMPMSFAGVLASLKTGKCHFTSSVIQTPERAESMIFSSVPIAHSANVLVVMKHKKAEIPAPIPSDTPKAPADDEPSLWDDIAASFQKTFIRESRWLLFAEGIMNTMIITVLSVFFGMVLGFTAFMFCRTGSRIANALTKFSVWLIKGTPIVVLLMILYYVIFGSIDIKGIWVAVIAFTLTFGTSVYRMLTFGTGAVDRGQTEAAYALGFTDLQTFFTVILPQAALHFMPSFKEEVTMLIKSTSVVGYIAVQDLTKMGDIVRSRTYEAFFPLIAVAVIYFVLAGMLNIIVTYIHVRITPSKRKPEDILKGIKLSGEEKLSHD